MALVPPRNPRQREEKTQEEEPTSSANRSRSQSHEKAASMQAQDNINVLPSNAGAQSFTMSLILSTNVKTSVHITHEPLQQTLLMGLNKEGPVLRDLPPHSCAA